MIGFPAAILYFSLDVVVMVVCDITLVVFSLLDFVFWCLLFWTLIVSGLLGCDSCFCL